MSVTEHISTGVFCPTPAIQTQPRTSYSQTSLPSSPLFTLCHLRFSTNSFPNCQLSLPFTTSPPSSLSATADSAPMPLCALLSSTYSISCVRRTRCLQIHREQIQNARENPLAAAAAAAAGGTTAPTQAQNNVENLLDIDFDGGAPASAHTEPSGGISGLEGLAGTPVRIASPAAGKPTVQTSNNLDDLLGVFGDPGAAQPSSSGANSGDLMNGLSGLDLSGNAGPSPNNQSKKSNDDILSLF